MLEAKHKHDIKAAALGQLKDQHAVLFQAVKVASEATTHVEAKQEGKYDTRAIEASYLAGAQAERLAELDQKILTLERLTLSNAPTSDRVKVTSLVSVGDEEGGTRWYMILPGAAGLNVKILAIEITVLSPESNLGIELLGKLLGEEVELTVGRVVKILTIEKII